MFRRKARFPTVNASDLSLTPEVGNLGREHYVRSINHFFHAAESMSSEPHTLNNPNSLCTPVTKQTQCPFLFRDLSSYICLFYLSHSPWRCGPVGVRSACSMTLRPRMFRQRVPLASVKRGCWLCKTGKSGTLKQQLRFHHIILSCYFCCIDQTRSKQTFARLLARLLALAVLRASVRAAQPVIGVKQSLSNTGGAWRTMSAARAT